jgi:hypothetical protein
MTRSKDFPVVSVWTRLQARQFRSDSQHEQEIVLFSKMSRPVVWLSQLPIHWMLATLSVQVKWLGCDVNHLLPSSAKAKYEWRCSCPLLSAFVS